jgi:hypothetical protein
MRMTPQQVREQISGIKAERISLRHDIECCECEIEYAICKQCRASLIDELRYLKGIDKSMTQDVGHVIQYLEERLAEDEMLNGWQGEDRYIDF